MIAAYQRTGHGMPSDDESLEVDDDGSFRLRRTNGSSIAGAFAGRVPDAQLDALRDAAIAAQREPPGDPPPPPSGRTVEYIAAGETGIAIVRGSAAPSEWGALADVLRRLALDLVDQPVAAIGAELLDGGRRLVLRQVGSEAVEADPGTASISLEAVDEAGERLGVWEAQLGDLLGEAADAEGDDTDNWERAPGWTLDVELPHDLPPGRIRGTLLMWIKAGGKSATAGLHVEAAAP